MPNNNREFDFTFEDFNYLRKISNEHSGIIVSDDKFDMFYGRLAKRIRKLGLSTFKEYCAYLEGNHKEEFTEFINAVTTNLTSFFREQHHFDFVKNQLIPEILERNREKKSITVWSAGCSTGEEPYSLAITLLENVPADWEIKILATDLDTNVIETAASGVYSKDRVEGLDLNTLKRWFQKGSGINASKVKLNKQCQSIIRFKQLNLMQDWPMQKMFDFIFCRNVLIYFDKDTKQLLAQRYSRFLASGCYLFIGHSESLHQLDTDFDMIGQTIYKKR